MTPTGGATKEYELKARLLDDVEEFAGRLEASGWELTYRGEMSDRRLDTPERRLEARDEVLRIREYRAEGGDPVVVLGWKGPASTAEGFKLREELELPVGSAEPLRHLLGRLGFTEVTLAIDRTIARFEKGSVVLRVERYPRMDVLVEIEGPPAEVNARIPELGLSTDAWKPWPLDAFVERFERRTGERAVLARRSAP